MGAPLRLLTVGSGRPASKGFSMLAIQVLGRVTQVVSLEKVVGLWAAGAGSVRAPLGLGLGGLGLIDSAVADQAVIRWERCGLIADTSAAEHHQVVA
jgi:hypothetical protein